MDSNIVDCAAFLGDVATITRELSDAAGGVALMDDVVAEVRSYLDGNVIVDISNAGAYLAAYPGAALHPARAQDVRGAVEEGVKALLLRRACDLALPMLGFRHAQLGDDWLEARIEEGLYLFDRHLSSEPFAPLRCGPAKLRAAYDGAVAGDDASLVRLGHLFRALASELAAKPGEASRAASRLRLAGQHCLLGRNRREDPAVESAAPARQAA